DRASELPALPQWRGASDVAQSVGWAADESGGVGDGGVSFAHVHVFNGSHRWLERDLLGSQRQFIESRRHVPGQYEDRQSAASSADRVGEEYSAGVYFHWGDAEGGRKLSCGV